MATVYRAHDERLDREVALKVLIPNLAADPAVAARFEREARTLAAATHPGVVSVYDVDPGDPATGREPFFVMELCPGGSLADRLGNGRRVAPEELVRIISSVADGLGGLHARGVVHRDVKPSNILLAANRAKLADFGLARSDATPPSDLTAPGTVAGTMAYLAPELLSGETAATPADVYALGVAAFAGLTGTLPRPATTLAELVGSARDRAARVSDVAPDLGKSFDAPIAAALDPDPVRRPNALRFAGSLTAALGKWLRAGSPMAAPLPADRPDVDGDATTAMATPAPSVPTARFAVPQRPQPGTRRLPRRFGLVAGAVAGAVAAIVLLALAAMLSRPTLPPTATPTASPQVTPSPIPSASPSPPPTVADLALAALDEVDATIAATAASGGLTGRDRNELERLAADARSALEATDLSAARDALEGLAEKVEDVADDLDEERARRLMDAVDAVLDILGGS
jgi:serine/threonine-protein kinase